MKCETSVNNVPDYARTKLYIVAKLIDGEMWFNGAFGHGQSDRAQEAAKSVDGIVLINPKGVTE